ncbi:MAG: NAD(P)/FAD-dependent oxidoreductase, partial [Paracoccaceae bacterium]
HRGLSGPAVLQSSSYWREGQSIAVNIAPKDMYETMRTHRQSAGRHSLKTELCQYLPNRLVDHLADQLPLTERLADQSDMRLAQICEHLQAWKLTPSGTEGYRTAEVTAGGIDTDGLSSKTMEAKSVPGLYAIGEAVDVTGWLGGYNFQWAWSSGVAAARAMAG